MGFGGSSLSYLELGVTVIVSLDEVLDVFLEGRNGGGFSLGDFVEPSNVISVEFVLFLSVFELNVGLAHFCFFREVI